MDHNLCHLYIIFEETTPWILGDQNDKFSRCLVRIKKSTGKNIPTKLRLLCELVHFLILFRAERGRTESRELGWQAKKWTQKNPTTTTATFFGPPPKWFGGILKSVKFWSKNLFFLSFFFIFFYFLLFHFVFWKFRVLFLIFFQPVSLIY